MIKYINYLISYTTYQKLFQVIFQLFLFYFYILSIYNVNISISKINFISFEHWYGLYINKNEANQKVEQFLTVIN